MWKNYSNKSNFKIHLNFWILDGFYIIDFQQNQELLEEIEKFLEHSVRTYDESKFKILIDLLQSPNLEFNLFASKSSGKLKENSKVRINFLEFSILKMFVVFLRIILNILAQKDQSLTKSCPKKKENPFIKSKSKPFEVQK